LRRPSVFTIAASADFAAQLALGLRARAPDVLPGDPLALLQATIYLPTRRAARGFGDAFARVMGGAALLPQFRALGETDEDDLLFDTASDDVELLPAIAPLRRQLLLAQLIRRWDTDGAYSFAQAAALAASLASVMDEVETQKCDLSQLKDLAPEHLAAHWEGVTRFLDILKDQWPAILAEEQAMNPAARRNAALRLLGQRLEASPPSGLVVAAGSTGSIPATAGLLRVIANLPNGAVVLPGLDRDLDAESWADLDPGHPQFGLKQLLAAMDCERADVRDWHDAPSNSARETLLRETLRPAPTTDAWLALAGHGADVIDRGLKDIALVNAADPAQEALAIALALRHVLETPGRTAALVTPDRNLARRVAAEMRRWNVAIDDSAGRPLAHTAAGSFLCLVAEAARARFAPVPLLALLKHPFATLGQDGASFRARARALDRWCLRGPRPDPGLGGITRAIAKAANAYAPPPQDGLIALAAWWDGVAAILAPLEDVFAQPEAPLTDLLDAHLAAAEALACAEREDCALWANADGAAAHDLTASLQLAGADVPPIEPASYAPLFRGLAMQAPVRAAYGRHPRLSILGPLEARLQRFDLTILGGLNEGSWPRGAGHDPWFSRPMRASLGLDQPERGIGQSAHDFAMLAAGPCVLMTRADKADGTKTIAARWLRRMEQLVVGLREGLPDDQRRLDRILAPDCDYAGLAAAMVTVPRGEPLRRPAPRPPVAARPRRLSVTEIETWLRDPYAIYARHILRLRPLAPLNEEVGPLERGNALHAAVEEFVRRYPGALPHGAAEELARIADGIFEQAGIPKSALAVWRPRFLDAARGFLEVERVRRAQIATPHVEKTGRLVFDAPGGPFELRGRADRIDVMSNGGTAILDYKSGAVPSRKQVETMLSPQLPLEAAMLAEDGFGIGKFLAEQLIYLSLADGRKARDPLVLDNGMALAAEALERLKGRVARFDDPATAYHPHVIPFKTRDEGDYDHLARVREWSATTEEA
jgi:ATP-dependent helicase/nuclease subunit B